ncbi:serine/threonine-protein kinase [Streptosporangium sp. NBC_01756]|uniref:serine/threonine-protein kinase n=1 Tax=Streptosporangium sp. NBC_01756 TaxID=2975950 RepID=UPI002DDC2DB3|nr:serine/threonine-protein kinase [Streptosporangium sp. NBC_01756]WSC83974.1 serine/threonine protein kinase [Streptosporangium sp. NBC_01756]
MSRIDSRVIAGRYRLLNPLAEGGMGTVWLAADEMLGRDVAVKEVRLPPDLDPVRREEISAAALQEANLAARLKHPSIVTVHDVVVEQERPWLIMELLSGSSLEQTVRGGRSLPVRQAARIGVSIISALMAAHAAGVMHRDVKPGNVFLTRTGRAVLTDFGIAVLEGDATAGTSHLVGSPNYIAPERLRGERSGPASDLWSLGATLYFAVEGMPPHPAETPISAISRVLTEPARPPERAGELGPLLMLMLAPVPEARPSFEAVARALQELALGRPAPLPGGSRPEAMPPPPAPAPHSPAPAPRGGRTVLWAVAEVAVVAMVIGATVGVSQLTADRTEPATPVKLSEKPGAFATPVDLCKLVQAATVKELLPALKTEGQPTNEGGCQWATSGVGLEVAPSSTSKQWGKSPRQAHELFVNQRNGTRPNGETAWSWSEIDAGLRSARVTAPLEVKPVGDEAFGYDLYENRKTGRLEKSQVVLRVDNLVVDVGYTVVDGSKDGTAIRSGAHTAATWVANALNKQKATPR